MKKTFFLFAITSLIALSSCSVKDTSNPSTGADFTVLRVSNSYLRALFAGNVTAVDRMVDWAMFSRQASSKRPVILKKVDGFSKEQFSETISLATLKVNKVQVKESRATVVLEKLGEKDLVGNVKALEALNQQAKNYFPVGHKVRIGLYWGGNNWLIAEDNIL